MKINVPTDLRDVKLSQYVTYLKEVKKAEKKSNPIEYINIKKLEIFCNLTYKEVLNIKASSFNPLCIHIDTVLQQEGRFTEIIKLGDIKFGWVPNLDDLNWGEFLDLNNNISDWETIYISMGVLYRPIKRQRKGKYLVKEYEGDKYHHLLKDMPMDIVMGANVFFWNLGMDLGIATVNYLMEKAQLMPSSQTLIQNGDGTQQSTNYLVETLQSLKK
jgi:hypothetical protein